jgi:hypothetical protein
MANQPAEQLTDLKVVASKLERAGHHTIGVIIDGAFVPIAQHVDGLVEAMKTRWSALGGTQVDSFVETAVTGLETRLASLEQAHALLEAKVNAAAPAPAPAPAADPPEPQA